MEDTDQKNLEKYMKLGDSKTGKTTKVSKNTMANVAKMGGGKHE